MSAGAKSRCHDHEVVLMRGERCPHCALGIQPHRILRAIRDFANQPMPGTVDVPAHIQSIRFSEVARRIGRELVAIEAERLARCADLDLRSRELRRQMKRVRLSPAKMNRAVRVAVGFREERSQLDALGRTYLSVIEDDGINW